MCKETEKSSKKNELLLVIFPGSGKVSDFGVLLARVRELSGVHKFCVFSWILALRKNPGSIFLLDSLFPFPSLKREIETFFHFFLGRS